VLTRYRSGEVAPILGQKAQSQKHNVVYFLKIQIFSGILPLFASFLLNYTFIDMSPFSDSHSLSEKSHHTTFKTYIFISRKDKRASQIEVCIFFKHILNTTVLTEFCFPVYFCSEKFSHTQNAYWHFHSKLTGK